LTIGLEEGLNQLSGTAIPGKLWSPYRAPLARFLTKYTDEAVAYFLDVSNRLANTDYFSRLLDIIRRPIGRPLLLALAASEEKLLSILRMDPASSEGDTKGKIYLSNPFICIRVHL
jgi:hypothetical protein